LCERIGDAKVANGNKLRLAMLYALRYEERPEFANHMTQVREEEEWCSCGMVWFMM
jgi:hypothetical protein